MQHAEHASIFGENKEMTKIEILKNALQDHTQWFDDQSTRHKKLYRRLRYSAFVMAAAATILSSAALVFPAYQAFINLTIVFITASVGVVSSIEGLRKPAELWIHERTSYYALKDLALRVDYATSEPYAEEELDFLFNRLQTVLGGSVEKWSTKVQPATLSQALASQQHVDQELTVQTHRRISLPLGDDQLKLPRDLQEPIE
jgi:hypothetical protein